jgi:hypothetical protein
MGKGSFIIALWFLVSVSTLALIAYFTSGLLDPYCPTFIGVGPGILLAASGVSLITAVATVTLFHFRVLFDSESLAVLLQTGATFCFALTAMTYALSFSSSRAEAELNARVFSTAIAQCSFEAILCDQFKQAIGDIDMGPDQLRPRVERYVHGRTAVIGRQLIAALGIWLVLHAAVVFTVFGGPDAKPLEESQPEIFRESSDEDE